MKQEQCEGCVYHKDGPGGGLCKWESRPITHIKECRPDDEGTITISKSRIHELLIQLDYWHSKLGVELLPAAEKGQFDADDNYTQIEDRIHKLAKLCGLDYYADVRAVAYQRSIDERECYGAIVERCKRRADEYDLL